MIDPERPEVTLSTLHEDLAAGFGEMRAGFADLKTALVGGFGNLPTRESNDEMVRLLREANRLHAERFTPIDVRIREQYLEAQQVLRAVIEGHRLMIDGQRILSDDLRALIARIDALIRGRGDGNPAA
ncbi:MAG: hypothetical protein ACREJV_06930 [Candidatus Rokuibacteriota bacterium]